MELSRKTENLVGMLCGFSIDCMRKCLFRVLSTGPLPDHIGLILDGNRRYARKMKLGEGMGHRAGFLSLLSVMKYCFELGIKYISVYAFSIDNFRRKPQEVKSLMDLMMEKIEGLMKEESIVNKFGVRVFFIGNLKLLDPHIRIAAERAMKLTEKNSNMFLLVCVAYTSTEEIVHATQESCEELWDEMQKNGEEEKVQSYGGRIKLSDIEKHMYMAVAPDVDVLVRTSGEYRLSNFLLWQTWNGLLYSTKALWPEMGLTHLVWTILNFQITHGFFDKRKKQLLDVLQSA